MGLESIVAAIRRETDESAEAILADAERRATEIRTATAEEAAQIRAEASDSLDKVAAVERERTVNRARLAADRAVTAASEEAFEQALGLLDAKLSSLRDTERYPELLTQLIAEARAVLPDAGDLLVAPEDVELVERLISDGGLHVRASERIRSGVELVTGDGRAVDNTIEARLERALPHLRRLFVEEVPSPGLGPS